MINIDYYMIIRWVLHDYYIIIMNGKYVIIEPLLHCMQWVFIITHHFVIITKGTIITHFYSFQTPELADEG